MPEGVAEEVVVPDGVAVSKEDADTVRLSEPLDVNVKSLVVGTAD